MTATVGARHGIRGGEPTLAGNTDLVSQQHVAGFVLGRFHLDIVLQSCLQLFVRGSVHFSDLPRGGGGGNRSRTTQSATPQLKRRAEPDLVVDVNEGEKALVAGQPLLEQELPNILQFQVDMPQRRVVCHGLPALDGLQSKV